jgi:hypothetical protein
MSRRKKVIHFIQNEQAVLGLPMRLTVSLIIGTIALLAILSYILNPCLIPGRLIVSVSPLVSTISGEDPTNVSFIVFVNDTKNHPISGAIVVIKGLGGACSALTDVNGKINLLLKVHLDQGIHEGYLTLSVKAACHEPFEQQDEIKIVKTSE